MEGNTNDDRTDCTCECPDENENALVGSALSKRDQVAQDDGAEVDDCTTADSLYGLGIVSGK